MIEPIELHPIYTKASIQKSTQFSNLQNYANISADLNADHFKEKVKREQTSPKVIEKLNNNSVKNSAQNKGGNNSNQFYNKQGKKRDKNINDVITIENNHILDVRI